MKRLLQRANSLRDRVGLYQVCFGSLQGAVLAIAARFPRWSGIRVKAHSACGAAPALRLGTTDVSVYRQVMVDQEYEFNLIKQPRVIIDAGAHIGLASIWFATRYPNALIVAIEPEPGNFELLAANTASYPNVHALRAALWSTDSDVDLLDPGWGTWGFRIGEASRSKDGRVVPGVTIASLMGQYGLTHIDLLKVDIEGAEIEVFSNCSSWIENVDGIVAELHDRFRPGCSRAFFHAVKEFPSEHWKGENVFVARSRTNFECDQSG
jgi:FkbM family methyltransferase